MHLQSNVSESDKARSGSFGAFREKTTRHAFLMRVTSVRAPSQACAHVCAHIAQKTLHPRHTAKNTSAAINSETGEDSGRERKRGGGTEDGKGTK